MPRAPGADFAGRRERKGDHESLASDQAGNLDGAGHRRALPARVGACPGGIGLAARHLAPRRTDHHARARRPAVAGPARDRRQGRFCTDITGELESKVSASFENVPIERALRRIVGRSSYTIELAPRSGADTQRRIDKLSVFARAAQKRVKTKRGKSSATKTKRGKSRATKTKRQTD